MGYFERQARRAEVPVIRRESKSVLPVDAPRSLGNRPAPSGDSPDSGSVPAARPDPAGDIRALAATLEEIKLALAEQNLKTQTRVVRGLEALDRREDQRQSAAQSALEAAIGEVAANVDLLRHELRIIDRSARRQVEELSVRMYSTLDGIVEVLGYLKSEIAAIHYSLDATRAETRLQSKPSPAEGAKRT
jgi:hypothetical protein